MPSTFGLEQHLRCPACGRCPGTVWQDGVLERSICGIISTSGPSSQLREERGKTRLHDDAAPTMRMDSGSWSTRERCGREDGRWLKSNIGVSAGSEPVAMMIFSAPSVTVPPSVWSTITRLPALASADEASRRFPSHVDPWPSQEHLDIPVSGRPPGLCAPSCRGKSGRMSPVTSTRTRRRLLPGQCF